METPKGSACLFSKRVRPWKAIFSHTMLMSGLFCSCTGSTTIQFCLQLPSTLDLCLHAVVNGQTKAPQPMHSRELQAK